MIPDGWTLTTSGPNEIGVYEATLTHTNRTEVSVGAMTAAEALAQVIALVQARFP